MVEARVERRLAAILAADVAGYSRLMGIDEEGTLAALKGHRSELIDPKIAEYRGRIVKTTGDGALVEFSSALDAVRCAVEIQREMAERNAQIPQGSRIELRIGINIGDVIIDEADIFGDGVNIAARLETLASPGAICLSENVYQQIKGKLPFNVSDMGEHQLKNIAQRVHVYGVRVDTEPAGLDPKHFSWPPASDPNRAPYRGLRALEADDAGIFFGRDAQIVQALSRIADLREAAPPRLLVILGGSGAGKSSFLRAGLLPRLKRDINYLALPIVRPARAAISGETGLLRALEGALESARVTKSRADLRAAIQGGIVKLKPILEALADKATPTALDTGTKAKAPTLILSVDQAEELFLAEAQDEAQAFLALLRDLLNADAPATIAIFTIRSDNYERIQLAKELEGVRQELTSLPPLPRGSYAEVIKGPAQRLERTARAFAIEESLVDALLADIDAGGAKDALPLLAFTIGRLYAEYHAGGTLRLSHYTELGGVQGSIEAAIEHVFKGADGDAAIPKDRGARLALLRRGLIPWLAGVDPETGALRRRVARLSEIPAESRPLIQHLVEQRLLATDVAKDTGENTIEPAHEALLRQWGLLQGWLTEDAGLLAVLEGVKRASRDWAANAKSAAWLVHSTDRLVKAERLKERPDLAANLELTDRAYLAGCRKAEADAERRKRRAQSVIYMLLVGIIASLIGWINQSYLREAWIWYWNVRPFIAEKIKPNVLTSAAEKALKPKDVFKECVSEQGKDYCPEMVVVPAGSFMMGSLATEKNHRDNEGPQHNVTFAIPFAVSRFELTFDEWDTCVNYGGCATGVGDNGFGRGQLPAVNLTWHDAQRYAAWLSRVTGKPYRLLTDAEFEYAARAGTQTVYPWGDDVGKNNANCYDCGSQWSNRQTAPVGSFAANGFGLHDMVGNVFEWVEDCDHSNYEGAPTDGSAWITGCTDERRRIVRGGSFNRGSFFIRSAKRHANNTFDRYGGSGFRVARTLTP